MMKVLLLVLAVAVGLADAKMKKKECCEKVLECKANIEALEERVAALEEKAENPNKKHCK